MNKPGLVHNCKRMLNRRLGPDPTGRHSLCYYTVLRRMRLEERAREAFVVSKYLLFWVYYTRAEFRVTRA